MNAISNVEDINKDLEETEDAASVKDTPAETDAEAASTGEGKLVEQSADEVQLVEPSTDETSAGESDQGKKSKSDTWEQEDTTRDTDTQEQEDATKDTARPEEVPKGAKKKQEKKSKSKKKRAEPKERIEDKVFSKINEIDLPNIDMGAVFAGVESLCKNAKKFDSQITGYAGGLFAKVTDYFKHSIETYKEEK